VLDIVGLSAAPTIVVALGLTPMRGFTLDVLEGICRWLVALDGSDRLR
jgi:hypothetical protein